MNERRVDYYSNGGWRDYDTNNLWDTKVLRLFLYRTIPAGTEFNEETYA